MAKLALIITISTALMTRRCSRRTRRPGTRQAYGGSASQAESILPGLARPLIGPESGPESVRIRWRSIAAIAAEVTRIDNEHLLRVLIRPLDALPAVSLKRLHNPGVELTGQIAQTLDAIEVDARRSRDHVKRFLNQNPDRSFFSLSIAGK